MSKKIKKYDVGVIREIQAKKVELDKIESKYIYDIVCNHIALRLLFEINPFAKVDRIKVNKTPPEKMTGYVYLCSDCEKYLHNINKETAKQCFTSIPTTDTMKMMDNYEKCQKNVLRKIEGKKLFITK